MVTRTLPPKERARRFVGLLRPQRPDSQDLKKVFQHPRALGNVRPSSKRETHLPDLLTAAELVACSDTVWQTRQPLHLVRIKLLICTGIRHAALTTVRVKEGDFTNCHLRSEQGKGKKARSVRVPHSFGGELAQYGEGQKENGATDLCESNRCRPYSTRRIRQILTH